MSDTTANKWAFTSDEARRAAIVEEAEINAQAARDVADTNHQAAVDVAETSAPPWHWVAFWIGLFAYLTAGVIYK